MIRGVLCLPGGLSTSFSQANAERRRGARQENSLLEVTQRRPAWIYTYTLRQRIGHDLINVAALASPLRRSSPVDATHP